MSFRTLATLFVLLALAGCGGTEDDAGKKPPKKEGRAETQSIRNTQAIGVNGKAIADKLDDALYKTEQHAKETERQTEEQTQ
jgi:hypothetical protein